MNYYSKFVPNLSTTLHPLNQLLKHDAQWRRTSECFKQVKEALVSSQVLAHYDPKLPIKMAADASSYGIGAVVSHVYPDGSGRPIASPRGHCLRVNEITHNWKRKHCHWYMASDIFIDICMEGVSLW